MNYEYATNVLRRSKFATDSCYAYNAFKNVYVANFLYIFFYILDW